MIVWPTKSLRTNCTTMSATHEALDALLDHPPQTELWNYTSKIDDLMFWYSCINKEQACDIVNFYGVRIRQPYHISEG